MFNQKAFVANIFVHAPTAQKLLCKLKHLLSANCLVSENKIYTPPVDLLPLLCCLPTQGISLSVYTFTHNQVQKQECLMSQRGRQKEREMYVNVFWFHSNIAFAKVKLKALASGGKLVACQLLPFLLQQWPAKLDVDDENIADKSVSPAVSLSLLYLVPLLPLLILQSKAIGKHCAATRDLLESWIDSRAWLQPLISGHAQSRPFDSWQRTDDSQARLITAN